MKGREKYVSLLGVFLTGITISLIYNCLIRDFLCGLAHKAFIRLCMSIDSIPFQGENTSGLIKALLTGDKTCLSSATKSYFRDSGASHVLALSGLHLGFIYLIIRKASAIFGNYQIVRYFRYFLICSFSIFYTLMTGGGASIVRAMLFIIIRESGIMFPERKSNPLSTLLSALILQCSLNPSIFKTVGFQLSYAALLGITLFAKPLQSFYPEGQRKGALKRIWDNMCVTVSCQIFTGPLCWYYFRSFPKYFLITNLIALPITSIVMALSVLTIFLSSIGVNSGPLINACDYSAEILIFLLKAISSL